MSADTTPADTLDVTDGDHHGRAEETRLAYARWRNTFAAWCEDAGRAPLPATPNTLVAFVDELASRKLAPSTVALAVSAVTSWHEDTGLPRPDPRRAQLAIRRYRQVRAAEGYRVRRVDPVRVEELRTLVAACPDDTHGLRDRALLLLGFALMGRRSVLARIEVSDLRRRREGLEVHVRFDKRQPTGRTVAIPAMPGDALDVVGAVDAWLAAMAAQGHVSGPLFRPVASHGGGIADRGVHPKTVWQIFTRAVERAGITDLDLSTHSLRAGGVTESYDAGADVLDIADHGGWVRGSSTLWIYIRGRDKWTNNPMAKALGAV